MTVTPGVSESARSLPLGGVCQRVKLDVALTPGVCVVNVSDGSRGWELLLLLSDNSAAFCRHSHAVVLWNEARKRRAKSDRQCNRHICKKHIHRLHTHKLNDKHVAYCNIQAHTHTGMSSDKNPLFGCMHRKTHK